MEISQEVLDKMGFEAKNFTDEVDKSGKVVKTAAQKAQEAFKKYQKEINYCRDNYKAYLYNVGFVRVCDNYCFNYIL